MCGIVFCKFAAPVTGKVIERENDLAQNIKHRGPDYTRTVAYSHAVAVFHSLRIVGADPEGMQPFEGRASNGSEWMCMVNGEIYNYRELTAKIAPEYKLKSQSDCEVVLGLFLTYMGEGIHKALNKVIMDLDGEYAIVLYNITSDYVIAVTDELRIRPLFFCAEPIHVQNSFRSYFNYYLVSEQKAAPGVAIPLQPGVIYVIGNAPSSLRSHDEFADAHLDESPQSRAICHNNDVIAVTGPVHWSNAPTVNITPEDAAKTLRKLLITNVRAKMHANRACGFLLSGGIDSSLICGIAARYCRERGLPRIRTFTVGFSPDAPDIIAARLVASHIDSLHEEIVLPYSAGIEIIRDVIKYNESWDQTTVRASIPMSLAARWIKKHHPDIAVIFSGEVADELLRGYLYNKIPATESEIRADMRMRLENISMFDALRADRVIASQGMEVRFPFFSRALLQFAFSLPWELLDPTHNGGVEKHLLRAAFDGLDFIPQSIIHRTKNAFSDATSVLVDQTTLTSTPIGSEWKEILKAHAEKYVSNDRFTNREKIYPGATIHTREDMYYMDIFDSFGYNRASIPFKWLPSWVDTVDSSATTLSFATFK
jgi:asparagine synthase (glutamine-hydrolysing)